MTPEEFIGEKAVLDEIGTYIFAEDKDGRLSMLSEVRGWGRIRNLFPDDDTATKFQDELGAWIVEAINEKLKREKDEKNR